MRQRKGASLQDWTPKKTGNLARTGQPSGLEGVEALDGGHIDHGDQWQCCTPYLQQ